MNITCNKACLAPPITIKFLSLIMQIHQFDFHKNLFIDKIKSLFGSTIVIEHKCLGVRRVLSL